VPTDRPNILIIQADQHRWDCLGAYGNPDVKTPHLDALTADGVRYDNSFCPYPVCTPSRYSFLTGLYARQHLGLSNHCSIPQGLPTFPRILQNAGYSTAAVGKMHLTPTYHDVGFQRLCLAEQNGDGRYDDDYHRYLKAQGQTYLVDLMDQESEYRQHATDEYWQNVGALVSDLDEKHHSTTWIADRAMDELHGWQDGGNLLMTSFIKPHHPFDPPAAWSDMYDADALQLLPGYLPAPLQRDLDYHRGYFPGADMTEAKIRRAMAYYYATVSQIDHQVGRMIAHLKENGLYDNTLILYNSDHGEYLGYHHMLLKGGYMYEPLIRVPLLIKYPGQANAGQASEALVNTVDLAPTLLNQAGCKIPASMAGMDLANTQEKRGILFAESGRGQSYMARDQRYKLLWCHDEEKSLFFDLQDDPYEQHNLYRETACQQEVKRLQGEIARWALFDAPAPVHLDEEAPIIAAPNARGAANGHRDEMYAYFSAKMKQTLSGSKTRTK
jgi:arylsulfatase